MSLEVHERQDNERSGTVKRRCTRDGQQVLGEKGPHVTPHCRILQAQPRAQNEMSGKQMHVPNRCQQPRTHQYVSNVVAYTPFQVRARRRAVH